MSAYTPQLTGMKSRIKTIALAPERSSHSKNSSRFRNEEVVRRIQSYQWLVIALGQQEEITEEVGFLLRGRARGLEQEGRQKVPKRNHAAYRGRRRFVGSEGSETDGLRAGRCVEQVHDRDVRSLNLERGAVVETEEGGERWGKRYGRRMRNSSTHRLDEGEVAPTSELGESRVWDQRRW